MRWLAAVVLTACHFSPGSFSGDGDADIATDDGRGRDGDVTGDGPDEPTVGPYVRLIDITDAKVTGAPHADFPLLVSLTTTWLKSQANGGDVVRDDGFDIFFSADQGGTTRLAHEVDTYSPTAGSLLAWVKIPSLDPMTTLYIHYGSPTITTSQEMKTAVWSGGYELVVHMDGGGDAANKNITSGTAVTAATGYVGEGRTYDGSTSDVDGGTLTAVDNIFAGGGTVEAWIRPASMGEAGFGRLFDKAGASSGYALALNDTNGMKSIGFAHTAQSSSVGQWVAPANSIAMNVWTHVALVYNKDSSANNPAMYLDGSPVALTEGSTPTGTLDNDDTGHIHIGNRLGADRTFDGIIDEARMSSSPRSADWIGTQYRNQSDPAGFYTVSAPL